MDARELQREALGPAAWQGVIETMPLSLGRAGTNTLSGSAYFDRLKEH